MRKAKIGDNIELTLAHVEWLIACIPEGYTSGGFYTHGKHDSELLALFAAREFRLPLRGVVEKLSPYTEDTGVVRAALSNNYGTFTGYIAASDYKILRPKKKGAKKRGCKK